MAENFEEVTRIPVYIEKGKKYRVEIQGSEVVISKESGWKDITKSCHLEFRDSQHCDGRYIAIVNRDYIGTERLVVVIGTQGLVAQKGYKIEKAPMAFTSFKVFKKV